jgi:hypothetical protein
MRSIPIEMHDSDKVVVIFHAGGAYSLAVGFSKETSWDYPVLGFYESRAAAVAAIEADRQVSPRRAPALKA